MTMDAGLEPPVRPDLRAKSWLPVRLWMGAMVLGAACLVACEPPARPTVAVTPICTILCVRFTTEQNPLTGVITTRQIPLVAERTDTGSAHGFTAFRRMARPLGNFPAAGAKSADVFGISEAWLRTASPVVIRADVHPALRPSFGDFNGSAWRIHAQDAAGSWSGPFATGSANAGDESDDPAAAGPTAPQLMEVGDANRQVFACAGDRSQDDKVRTTWLLEVKPPTSSTSGSVTFVQDLLSGDDRFFSDPRRDPLAPTTPPTPTISNLPGNPVREGSVQCAMRQVGDDVTTRELHLLTIFRGDLYHSMASNFSPAGSDGVTFNRFNTVTPWASVSRVIGSFGNIVSSAIVASRPSAVSVFFVAESQGRYRLFHAVRFSPSGAWRPTDDVLVRNGAAAPSTSFPFQVAAGMCPTLGQPHEPELVYATWDDINQVSVGRIVASPRTWSTGITGTYSPMSVVSLGRGNTGTRIQSLAIAARPFSENARPTP